MYFTRTLDRYFYSMEPNKTSVVWSRIYFVACLFISNIMHDTTTWEMGECVAYFGPNIVKDARFPKIYTDDSYISPTAVFMDANKHRIML